MKKLELTLTVREEDSFQIESIDKIEADSMISLAAQLQLLLIRVHERIMLKEIDKSRIIDDDIPF